MTQMTTLVVFLTLMICMTSISVADLSPEKKAEISNFIETTMKCRQIPGFILSIVSKDEVLMETGFGSAMMETGREMTKDTQIPIGSLTKAVNNVLLSMLMQNGNLTWDSRLKDILGDDFIMGNELLTLYTTLRDLASHRTGVPRDDLAILYGMPPTVTMETLTSRLKYFQPNQEMRTTFQYNNIQYGVLGRVAEVIAHKNWQQLIQEHIFDPIGMDSSTFNGNLTDWDSVAMGYMWYKNQHHLSDVRLLRGTQGLEAAGAIVSTARDMSKWLQFHLREGTTHDGQQLLTPAELQELFNPAIVLPLEGGLSRPTFPIADIQIGYALGWIPGIVGDYLRYTHGGAISAYRTRIDLYPDLGYGVFLATNGPSDLYADISTGYATLAISYFIKDILAGHEPWLNSTTSGCTFPNPWVYAPDWLELKLDDLELPQDTASPMYPYTGQYEHPKYDVITISRCNTTAVPECESDDHLYFEMGTIMRSVLHYDSSTDSFVMQYTGALMFYNIELAKSYVFFGGYHPIFGYSYLYLFDISDNFMFTRVGEGKI